MMYSHKIDNHTFIYQTNCLYTKDGQQIAVRLIRDNKFAMFYDICRMVYGVVRLNPHMENIAGTHELCAYVQDKYLHDDYCMDGRSYNIKPVYQVDFRELVKDAQLHRHHVPLKR